MNDDKMPWKVKRGYGDTGSYFYMYLPNGDRKTSCYEDELLNYREKTTRKDE